MSGRDVTHGVTSSIILLPKSGERRNDVLLNSKVFMNLF